LTIDYNNTLSKKYLGEIEKLTEGNDTKRVKEEKERQALSGNDVIIPETGYKDINYGVMQFVTIIVGILIGAAMVYFLITPAKENRATAEYKETINDYSDNISKLNITINELQSNIDALTAENESLAAQVTEAESAKDIESAYTAIIEAAVLYARDDNVNAALKLMEITDLTGKSQTYTDLYNELKSKTYEEAYRSYYNQAYQAENSSRYQDAIDAFLVCEKVQPENPEILYHLGKNYTMLNNGEADENAIAYYNKVIQVAPDSEFAGWSRQYVQ
ncbi:MAG: hypothetical protein ACLRVQ_06595, partial [Lachnospiraceae bacterium]